MNSLTEQQWNEVYGDVYRALKKALADENKTDDELMQIMEEIKKILITENDPVLTN